MIQKNYYIYTSEKKLKGAVYTYNRYLLLRSIQKNIFYMYINRKKSIICIHCFPPETEVSN